MHHEQDNVGKENLSRIERCCSSSPTDMNIIVKKNLSRKRCWSSSPTDMNKIVKKYLSCKTLKSCSCKCELNSLWIKILFLKRIVLWKYFQMGVYCLINWTKWSYNENTLTMDIKTFSGYYFLNISTKPLKKALIELEYTDCP